MKKRFLSSLLSLVLVLCTSCSAAAADTGFTDVPADADYAEAVTWCREKGLMNGVSDTDFDPNGTLTRAMLVTTLYRAEGEPAVSGAPAFTDAQAGTWYSNAVVWANQQGIVQGYGNGLFGTNDPVSVEQMEVILGRYTGEGPEWVGDPAKAQAALRSQVAVALYENLNTLTPDQPADPTPTPGATASSKALVIYFSRTNNTKDIAEKVVEATGADAFEITAQVPYTDADINYNNSNSRANREQYDPAARPAINETVSDLADYDVIFLGYPIWQGQAPKVIYTFLESCEGWDSQTIVPFCTSASSPAGSSATNLHALLPDTISWKDANRFSAGASQSTVTDWVNGLDLDLDQNEEEITTNKIELSFHGHTYTATLADNSSAEALKELLKDGPLTINMSDYGNMEKVGPIGQSLPTNNDQITTSAGDLILYQGSNLVIYYAQNSWNFTRLGRIDDPTGLRDALGSGSVSVTLSLAEG